MDKKLTLRIPEELNTALVVNAEKQELSVNSYIKKLIEEKTKTVSEPVERKSIRLDIPKDQMDVLKENAEKAGMGVQAYLTDIASRSSLVQIGIEVEDLHDLIRSMDNLVSTVNSMAGVIIRSGKAYESDMQKIVSVLGEINDKVNDIYRTEADERRRLYKEARKKVFSEIDANKTTGGRK